MTSRWTARIRDFAHGANGTITASSRKTARRDRTASHYEFASHRWMATMKRSRRRGYEWALAGRISNTNAISLAAKPTTRMVEK